MSLSRTVNLSIFGYNRYLGDEVRHTALLNAIDTHGVKKVLVTLLEVKSKTRRIYSYYANKVNTREVYTEYARRVVSQLADTDHDISYVSSIEDECGIYLPLPPMDDYDAVSLPLPPVVPVQPDEPKWRQAENDRFKECMKYLNLKHGYYKR